MNSSDDKKPQSKAAKQTKKRKSTYGVKFSVMLDHELFADRPTTPLVVVKFNGQITQPSGGFMQATDFPNPGATKMARFYNQNRQFMDEGDIKLATTIIEYRDKAGNPVAMLFPTNDLMVRDDIITESDLHAKMNHATRHDMVYQMRLRVQLMDKLAQKKKTR